MGKGKWSLLKKLEFAQNVEFAQRIGVNEDQNDKGREINQNVTDKFARGSKSLEDKDVKMVRES